MPWKRAPILLALFLIAVSGRYAAAEEESDIARYANAKYSWIAPYVRKAADTFEIAEFLGVLEPELIWFNLEHMLSEDPVLFGSAFAITRSYGQEFFAKWNEEKLERGVWPVYYNKYADFNMPESTRYLYGPYAARDKDKREEISIADIQIGYGENNIVYDEEDWFTITMKENCAEGCWGKPYFDEGGGDIVMVTFSMPLHKMVSGDIFGVLTIDLDVNDVQCSPTVDDPDRCIAYACQPGFERIVSENKGVFCSRCGEGYYSPPNQEKCIVCPIGAYCPGGLEVHAKSGYWQPDDWGTAGFDSAKCADSGDDGEDCDQWRKSNGYDVVYSCGFGGLDRCCVPDDAINATVEYCSIDTGTGERCKEGRGGIRCSDCGANYSRFGLVCLECHDDRTNFGIFLWVFLPLLASSILAFIPQTDMSAAGIFDFIDAIQLLVLISQPISNYIYADEAGFGYRIFEILGIFGGGDISSLFDRFSCGVVVAAKGKFSMEGVGLYAPAFFALYALFYHASIVILLYKLIKLVPRRFRSLLEWLYTRYASASTMVYSVYLVSLIQPVFYAIPCTMYQGEEYNNYVQSVRCDDSLFRGQRIVGSILAAITGCFMPLLLVLKLSWMDLDVGISRTDSTMASGQYNDLRSFREEWDAFMRSLRCFCSSSSRGQKNNVASDHSKSKNYRSRLRRSQGLKRNLSVLILSPTYMGIKQKAKVWYTSFSILRRFLVTFLVSVWSNTVETDQVQLGPPLVFLVMLLSITLFINFRPFTKTFDNVVGTASLIVITAVSGIQMLLKRLHDEKQFLLRNQDSFEATQIKEQQKFYTLTAAILAVLWLFIHFLNILHDLLLQHVPYARAMAALEREVWGQAGDKYSTAYDLNERRKISAFQTDKRLADLRITSDRTAGRKKRVILSKSDEHGSDDWEHRGIAVDDYETPLPLHDIPMIGNLERQYSDRIETDDDVNSKHERASWAETIEQLRVDESGFAIDMDDASEYEPKPRLPAAGDEQEKKTPERLPQQKQKSQPLKISEHFLLTTNESEKASTEESRAVRIDDQISKIKNNSIAAVWLT